MLEKIQSANNDTIAIYFDTVTREYEVRGCQGDRETFSSIKAARRAMKEWIDELE